MVGAGHRAGAVHGRGLVRDAGLVSHHVGQAGACGWRTPKWILDGVRESIQDDIDLDPATAPDNPTRARVFYCENGLELPWEGSDLFLNPPWSRKLKLPIAPWVARLNEYVERYRRLRPAFLVCPASANALWFQRHVFTADAILFPRGRVKYEPDPWDDAEDGSPTFDSVVAYWGHYPKWFANAFAGRGVIR